MKISVITVVWNGEATIADTLSSVTHQDWEDWEHIIVDGRSTDRTLEIIERNRHERMKVVSEPDNGIYDAMSKGLALATGDLVGFLNADDYFARPDSLSLLAKAAQSAPSAGAIAGALVLVSPQDVGRIIRTVRSDGYRPWMARFGIMVPHPATYVRRRAIDAVGAFDPTFKISGDFDWFVRMLFKQRLDIKTIETVVVVQRQGGVSTNGLASMRIGNAEISRSLSRHGVFSFPLMIWLKYLVKAFQLLDRPADYRREDRLRVPASAT